MSGIAGAGVTLADIRTIEEASFACRPSLQTVTDGDWVWRFAGGFTGRANSLQSLNIEDVGHVEKRLAQHQKRSEEFGIAPRFRVTPLAGSAIISVLDRQGWSVQGASLVMLADPAKLAEGKKASENITSFHPSTSQWQSGIAPLTELTRNHANIYNKMMQKLPESAAGFLLHGAQGEVLSGVLGVVANGVGCIFGLATPQKYRRCGFGGELARYALNWMSEQGAKTLALQVEGDNVGAISLYEKLGFETTYDYHYRVLGEK